MKGHVYTHTHTHGNLNTQLLTLTLTSSHKPVLGVSWVWCSKLPHTRQAHASLHVTGWNSLLRAHQELTAEALLRTETALLLGLPPGCPLGSLPSLQSPGFPSFLPYFLPASHPPFLPPPAPSSGEVEGGQNKLQTNKHTIRRTSSHVLQLNIN